MTEALDKMGKTTISMVYGLGWGSSGMAIGSVALSWIPIAGPIVGGLVGGVVGYVAGSTYGEFVYKGLKAVGKIAKKAATSTWEAIKSVGRGIREGLSGFKERVFG